MESEIRKKNNETNDNTLKLWLHMKTWNPSSVHSAPVEFKTYQFVKCITEKNTEVIYKWK